MEKNRNDQHRLIYVFSLLLAIITVSAICLSCSSSKQYGQSEHKRSQYKTVKVKQPRWNTTTSNSTTYYIKKQKQRKRYNP